MEMEKEILMGYRTLIMEKEDTRNSYLVNLHPWYKRNRKGSISLVL